MNGPFLFASVLFEVELDVVLEEWGCKEAREDCGAFTVLGKSKGFGGENGCAL